MLAIINDFISEPSSGGLLGGFYSCKRRRHCRIQIAFSRRACGSTGSTVAPGQSSTMSMMITIQQAPEWLRLLPLMLPASRPRPIGKRVSGDSKRKRNSEWDSPDEENGGNRGGYGSQFRSRQLHLVFCSFWFQNPDLTTKSILSFN
jgi:hypothetical protein